MNKGKTYEDTVLIKLRRDYSRDEVVMFALNKIKALGLENGKLKSYIDELEHEVQQFQLGVKNKKTTSNSSLENELKIAKENNKNLKVQIGILNDLTNQLRNSNNNLKNQAESKNEIPKTQADSFQRKIKMHIHRADSCNKERNYLYNRLKNILPENEMTEINKELDNITEEHKLEINK